MGKHGQQGSGRPASVRLEARSPTRGVPQLVSAAVAATFDDAGLVVWAAETGRIRADLSVGYMQFLSSGLGQQYRDNILSTAAGRYDNAGAEVWLERPPDWLPQGVSASIAALATERGVNTDKCRRSGPGCTVTVADVEAEATRLAAVSAASAVSRARASSEAAAAASSDDAAYGALFGDDGSAADAPAPSVDLYARNPLLANSSTNAAVRIAASSGVPAPTLFANGDLPAATASGMDPALLLRVPWNVRHTLAAAGPGEAYRMLEDFSGAEGELAASMHPTDAATEDYQRRFSHWASTAGT